MTPPAGAALHLVELVLAATSAGIFDPRADVARIERPRPPRSYGPVQTTLSGCAHPPPRKGSR